MLFIFYQYLDNSKNNIQTIFISFYVHRVIVSFVFFEPGNISKSKISTGC